ncbi:sugar transferase [Rhodovastum atsumiense]|nr:sugar transferase [Rhodovastum atsumiense]
MDLGLGLAILVIISPILLIIALVIRLETPGPVLFRQPRAGKDNEIFMMLKFRTMYSHLCDIGADRQTSRNDDRITRVGRFLRKTSLDELPQLLNVVGGTMSLVGPRPHALATKVAGVPLEAAVPTYHSRHRVKPGMTGLAQVSGARGALTTLEQLERRVQLDVRYINTWSIALDFWILWRTALLVVADPDAY